MATAPQLEVPKKGIEKVQYPATWEQPYSDREPNMQDHSEFPRFPFCLQRLGREADLGCLSVGKVLVLSVYYMTYPWLNLRSAHRAAKKSLQGRWIRRPERQHCEWQVTIPS